MLQGIVFDFDGVMVDSEPLHYQAYLDVLAEQGVRFDYAQYLEQYIGFDDRDALRTIARDFNLPLDEAGVMRLIERKADAFEARLKQGIAPYPGVVELVESAAAANWPLAICSGALLRDIQHILPALAGGRLAPRFRTIVAADHVERSKPDPQGYRLAAEQLGLPPGNCLAIEDTPAGLTAARSAGLRTLAVAHTYPAGHLQNYADRVVQALRNVTAEELREWFG